MSISLFISLFFIRLADCAPTVDEASWQNWHGGIRGSGGVRYEVGLNEMNCSDLKLDSIVIDGESIKSKLKLKDAKVTIYANDDRSISSEEQFTPSVQLRATAPMSCKIYLSNSSKSIVLEVKDFAQKKDAYFQ